MNATGARGRAARGRAGVLAATAAAAFAAGCSMMPGRPAPPLLASREEPGVVLCLSERTADGGIRLIGRMNTGVYPVTGVVLEYRTAPPSSAAPTIPEESGRGLRLATPHTVKIPYRSGAEEVVFEVDGRTAARELADKVLWYRWVVTSSRTMGQRAEATRVHRTSLDEAGLPRATGNPGPDTSVEAPATRRR